jgi:type IV pilus assembly protein PilF
MQVSKFILSYINISAVTCVVTLLLTSCSSTTTVESRVPDTSMPSKQTAAGDMRKRASAHTELGGAYFQERKWAIALEEASQAIRDDSTFGPAHALRGLIYMETRNVVEARASFDRALALSPGDSELLNSIGWFECQLGDMNRALELFSQVKRDPFYSTPYKPLMNEGLCLKKVGRIVEAQQSLMQALRVRPDLLMAHQALAEIYFADNKMRDAEQYINNAISLGNPSPETLLLAARVARGLGDKSSESSYVAQLRRRYPDSPQSRAITATP